MKQARLERVVIEKLIYGGQGIGELADGKKVFVWGALPGETATVQITKSKKSWAEGIAKSIESPSSKRIAPKDPESYLSTSPWQILDYSFENQLKHELIEGQFTQHNLDIKLNDFSSPEQDYYYRNKVEFSWWWDNKKGQLDLAFFKRGSHTKQPVSRTSLAMNGINQAAQKIRDFLRKEKIEAYSLKTLLIRVSQSGQVAAQLYVKDEKFPKLNWDWKGLNISGLEIHYSNPKSPASVSTKPLQSYGETKLTDKILGKDYTYSVDGFFQVNLSIYQTALEIMQQFIDPKLPLLDMYSGVGSIGLSLAKQNQKLTLIETDESCVREARQNAQAIKPDSEIIHSDSEKALDYIRKDQTLIVDPPRVGLHQKVIDKILEAQPQRIVYLSCNPATQARDVKLLESVYQAEYAHGFNFFPRTPHIENLIILSGS